MIDPQNEFLNNCAITQALQDEGTMRHNQADVAVSDLDYRAEDANKLFHAYPNPVGDEFLLSYKDANRMELLNALGAVLLTRELGEKSGQEMIDVSSLPTGVYFVRLYHTDDSTQTKKVIVSR
ncbi:MAG: T9SS type A sorting domain-containing protein [Cyanobacteria bacterium J06649_11]